MTIQALLGLVFIIGIVVFLARKGVNTNFEPKDFDPFSKYRR